LPVPATPPVRFPAPSEALDQAPAPSFELATLQQSAAAYVRASKLEEQAAARMREVTARTEQPVPAQPAPRRPARTPEAMSVVHQLRHPRTARQAILASLIFAPPKALE
jgi:hypothetical protein